MFLYPCYSAETIEGIPGGLEVLLEEDVMFINPVVELVGSKGVQYAHTLTRRVTYCNTMCCQKKVAM